MSFSNDELSEEILLQMGRNGLVYIDVYNSIILKEDKPQSEIEQIFSDYYLLLEEISKRFNGKIWHRIGESYICIFPTSEKAVEACIRLLESLVEFNKQRENLLSGSLFLLCIGIHEIELENIEDIPKGDQDTFAHPAIDIVRELQSTCPIGKIIISMNVYENLGFTRRLFRPSGTETRNKRNFVLTDRLIMPQEEEFVNGLTNRQKMAIPPIPILSWNTIRPDDKINLARLTEFLKEPLLVILGETLSQPKGPICPAATSDAVGVMEVLAALQSNHEVRVGIDHWEDTADIASDRNIIIVGSGMINIYAFALNDLLQPVHFVKTRGRVLDRIVATSKQEEVQFGPHALPSKDTGLLIISKSPFNPQKVLLWIAGITGMGTQAVASLLRNINLDSGNISERDIFNSSQPIACVVKPEITDVGDDWKISDYYGRMRISDYRILWMVDRNENRIALKLS